MIRNSTNELSIKPKMSAPVRLALVAGVVVLVAAGIYAAYISGVRSGHQQFDQDRIMISQLDKTIEEVRREFNIVVVRHSQLPG